MRKDIYIVRRNTTLSMDAEKEDGEYILTFQGIPAIKRDDIVTMDEDGKKVQMKIKSFQQVTNKSRNGQATRMFAIPLIATRQEVKTVVDMYKDGDSYRLSFDGSISFQDEEGKTVQLEADPYEINAIKTKGAK